jgi:site-specific DNA-methyltransferase (adenine-specific)
MNEDAKIDLRLGDWRDVIADVECDALICDPPYGARTHKGYNDMASGRTGNADGHERQSLGYASFGAGDVHDMVASWSPRVRGWMCAMTSHDLVTHWIDAYEASGRYAFAPVGIVQKRHRQCGDGPASWLVYLVVARPRCRPFSAWGSLPGIYEAPTVSYPGISGAKPLSLMRAIVGDYTSPGDVVCDPCAGYATTLVAARDLGCQAIGAEIDPATHARASKRLTEPWQEVRHPRTDPHAKKRNRKAQATLF